MKKIISIALCTLIAVLGVVSTSAAEVFKGVISQKPYLELVGEKVYVPNNTIMKYAYNIPSNYQYYLSLNDIKNTNKSIDIKFTDCKEGVKFVSGINSEYIIFSCNRSGGSSTDNIYSYDNTGAYYQKVKVKLSDFSDYFNEDGSRTYTIKSKNDTHNYDFTDGPTYKSGLIITSGAAMTAVIPKKDGTAEFYIKLTVGKSDVEFYTNLSAYLAPTTYGTGSNEYPLGLGMGNVNLNGALDISDATDIQKMLVNNSRTDKLYRFLADANGDGIINVLDATTIQKALAS